MRRNLHISQVLEYSFRDTLLQLGYDGVPAAKPDRLIFDQAVASLGVPQADILFVGDNLKDDYEGARAAGIDFCYYNPGRKPADGDSTPDYTIHALFELEAIISREEEQR
ncbi:HAD family hydrolase [Paenibacillus sp. GCM10023250]|uniref:HAD family hydrolase n=1 Tax=Paenibacillus sp. GCM10023250 TaxID=3252648 RepID=UPI00361E37CB